MAESLTSLIEAMGGAQAVAATLSAATGQSLKRKAVYNWRYRGWLPPKWAAPLYLEAERLGLEVSLQAIIALTERSVSHCKAA